MTSINSKMITIETDPLISVVIPAYNHGLYIEECLDSILLNLDSKIELIIIDDGSRDDTFARAEDWILRNGHKIFRVILESQENQGVSVTLNRLIHLSSGQFVIPLASDDILTRGSIKARLAEFSSDPEIYIVFGDCYSIDECSNLTSPSVLRYLYGADTGALMSHHRIKREIIMRWAIPGPATMFRREAYNLVTGQEKYDKKLIVEDRIWYLRIMASHLVKYIDKPVAYYRIHKGNTISNSGKRMQMMNDVMISELSILPKYRGLNYLALKITMHKNKRLLKLEKYNTILNKIKFIFIKIIYNLFYKMDRAVSMSFKILLPDDIHSK